MVKAVYAPLRCPVVVGEASGRVCGHVVNAQFNVNGRPETREKRENLKLICRAGHELPSE